MMQKDELAKINGESVIMYVAKAQRMSQIVKKEFLKTLRLGAMCRDA